VTRARLVVTLAAERDEMTLRAEAPDPAIAEALSRTLQGITRLRGEVRLEEPGALPNDGKVIEDTRT
jgi:phenylacetate-CoA ligase